MAFKLRKQPDCHDLRRDRRAPAPLFACAVESSAVGGRCDTGSASFAMLIAQRLSRFAKSELRSKCGSSRFT